jgi:hypothetical protein
MTEPVVEGKKTPYSALRTQHFFLLLICLLYLVVAALFAVYTPAWQAPDEPAHYNYVRQVAENGCCPVIEIGDWNLAYQGELTSGHFAPELLGDLDALQYEDHQPPLYYLLASVMFKLTHASLTGLRLFSVFISLGVVLSTYGVGRAMYPERPWIGLGAAALVAFVPQHVTMMAAVNNDGLGDSVSDHPVSEKQGGRDIPRGALASGAAGGYWPPDQTFHTVSDRGGAAGNSIEMVDGKRGR